MHVSYNGKVTDKTIGSHLYMQVKVPASCSWNPDWDGRMRDGIHPQSERRIYLIRHGHYKTNSEDKGLTDIGYQQAELLATHLAECRVSPLHVWSSTQTRAKQTAGAIAKLFPMAIVQENRKLNEGHPCEGYPPTLHRASSEVCVMYLKHFVTV